MMLREKSINRIRHFLDGKLSLSEEKSLWMDVAASKEVRALFYLVLVERWHNKNLSPQFKNLAIKLYKESPEFKDYFIYYENNNKAFPLDFPMHSQTVA